MLWQGEQRDAAVNVDTAFLHTSATVQRRSNYTQYADFGSHDENDMTQPKSR